MEITFTLNGQATTVDVPAEMPMLWVLRDTLDMKGTKFGCGMGQCGACTVHIDGKAQRTCRLAAEKAQGAAITTVEGLSPDGQHPVQLAWQEIDVPQCGYCQAGQIMTASALLANNSSPTDQDIDEAMEGNLCRCATYTRIRKAIHRSAEIAAGSAATSGAAGSAAGGGAR